MGSEGWLGPRIERSLSDTPPHATELARPACGASLFPAFAALLQGQRFHPPLWPLGARTLRRHISSAHGAVCPRPPTV
ncbi:MAG: hypothetical protein ABR961_13035, partial [Thermoanaerobaculaceae bacterium]